MSGQPTAADRSLLDAICQNAFRLKPAAEKAALELIARHADEREAQVIAGVVAWLRGQAESGDRALLNAIEGSTLRRDLAAGVVAINRAADAIERGDWKGPRHETD